MFVDNTEDFGSDLLSLGEELVECCFTCDPTHGGLGELEHGVIDVFYLIDGFAGVDYFVVDNRVHLAANVVFGNSVLLGDIHGLGADINFSKRLKDGDDEFPTRTDDVTEFAHGIDDTTLIFVDLFERN